MREHIRLGRVAGIPVGLNLSVLVIFVLVVDSIATQTLPGSATGYPAAAYWAVGLVIGALFFASLLAHELAHALVARRYGVPVVGITLWMLGGVAQFADEPPTPRADLRIAAAGPVTSLAASFMALAGAVSSSWAGGPALLTAGLSWLAGINVLLAVFNLLPAAPLDGGRVLRAMLWRRSHDRTQAAVRADRAGRRLGLIMIGLGAAEVLLTNSPGSGLWLMLLGWFLSAAAAQEATATIQHALLRDLRVRDAMTPDPVCLPDYQLVERAVPHIMADQHTCYPVIGFDGHLVGLVKTAQVTRLPAAERATQRIGDLTVPRQRVVLAEPDEPLNEVLERAAGAVPVVVVEHDVPVGLVTESDVNRCLQRQSLSVPAAG